MLQDKKQINIIVIKTEEEPSANFELLSKTSVI